MADYETIADTILSNMNWEEYCYHTSGPKDRWERAEPYIIASGNYYINSYFIKAYGEFYNLESEAARNWWRDTFGACDQCNGGLSYVYDGNYKMPFEDTTFCSEYCADEYWRESYKQRIQDELDEVLYRYNITDEDTREEIINYINELDNYFDNPDVERELLTAGYLKD